MKVLDESFLLDTFMMSGEKEEDFETMIQSIDKHTTHLLRDIDCLNVISLIPSESQDNNKDIKAYYLEPKNPVSSGCLQICELPQQKFMDRGNFAKLIQEAVKHNSTLFLDTGYDAIYFISESAYNTLGQRLCINGEALHDRSIERDLFIAKKMDQPLKVTLVIKHYREIGKVFAVMSDKYAQIPLFKICELYTDLGEEAKLGPMTCLNWRIDHDRVQISFAFNKYAQDICALYGLKDLMTPCVELLSSDTGESSITIKGFWKTGHGNIVYDSQFSKKHSGKIDWKEIEDAVQETIFSKYTELPERLLYLMSVDVTPSDINLLSKRGSGKNHNLVMQVIRYIFKKIDLVKSIGKSPVLKLTDYMDYNMICDDQHYTVYDIIMDVFSLPESMDAYLKKERMSDEIIRRFRVAVSKAPYLKFEPKNTEQSPLFLTAI